MQEWLVTDHRYKVLMLGWEYPPRYAGGLGKACRGLSVALSKHVDLTFVLPTFPEPISEPGLTVLGAKDCLQAQGWSEERIDAIERTRVEYGYAPEGFRVIRSGARLFPYGEPPEGPMPELVRETVGARGPSEGAGTAESAARGKAPGAPEIYGKNLWSEIERFALSVRQLAETVPANVVHAHDWMTFPAAFAYQQASGAPVFLHVHATEYDRSGEKHFRDTEIFKIEKEAFRRADHIFAVSGYTAGVIEAAYGVSRSKISVIYNAPDEAVTSFTRAPEAPRKRTVVFLGRLTFQKGPEHFLEAAALVARADRTARFVFCGTGDLQEKLREQAEELGIGKRVEFAGFLGPRDVDRMLESSKVLVMPSVSEPFGLVALEAIRCGIPVIVSKQSGVREVLRHTLQVDFWDYERLADQVLGALKHSHLSKQLVLEGLDELKELSWSDSALAVMRGYGNTVPNTTRRETAFHVH